ncbi:hypothetical protein [Sinorhizobium fredii]
MFLYTSWGDKRRWRSMRICREKVGATGKKTRTATRLGLRFTRCPQ